MSTEVLEDVEAGCSNLLISVGDEALNDIKNRELEKKAHYPLLMIIREAL